jgi:hypothetical protein
MKHELIKRENYLLIVDDSKKTIAHLPLNGAPVLEGVDLLPPIEGEAGELANIFSNGFQLYLSLDMVGALREGFVSGYNKAKEKYKYPEEDLRKAFNAGLMNRYSRTGEAVAEEEFIQSLQQTKMPVGFECGMEMCENNDVVFEDGSFNKSPYRLEKKKIKNLEVQTVWVGKYIFND